MPFTIAIIGRPNVGKSTLFNRLVGKRLALVDDLPGVTRDRREGEARLGDLKFRVIDTAGLEDAAPEALEGRMRVQTEAALAEADLVLFLIDARAGVTPLDSYFADWLRKGGVPVGLIANKCEGRAGEAGLLEAFSLGLGEPIAFSAEHGEGMGALYDLIRSHVEAGGVEPDAGPAEKALQLAIIGRPNVGKSTLINALVGEERLLTGPEAGITRDSIAIEWRYGAHHLRLFDTAGMRRRARVTGKLEKLSVADSLRAIQFAQVAVLVLDAQQPLDKQDRQIAALVEREGRALVVALNKWDLVRDRQARLREIERRLDEALPQIRGVALIPLSARSGAGLERLIPAVLEAHETWNKRVPTAAVNRWLEDVIQRHPPPASKGRRIRLRFATQARSRPPTFMIATSRPEDLPESYRRYLVNDLREAFDLWGVPLRVKLRKGKNPYV